LVYTIDFTATQADGSRLILCARDEGAARILAFFARAARLPLAPEALHGARRLWIVMNDEAGESIEPGEAVCKLDPPGTLPPHLKNFKVRRQKPFTEEHWFWLQLLRLSACIAHHAPPRGGVLLHSGLALLPPIARLEKHGRRAVLLAGRSGVGKSTASQRLPSPWCSLSDDVTLVVQNEQGAFLAHPWPTWSLLIGPRAGDGSDSWDVQQAARLQGIFILEQGEEERAEPLGSGHAVCLLNELAVQSSKRLVENLPPDEMATFNLQYYQHLCALVKAIPAYLLFVRLDGAFWNEIERLILD
jgi:SynChlorMet cassette protein ScmC